MKEGQMERLEDTRNDNIERNVVVHGFEIAL